MDKLKKIFDFIIEIEKLKDIHRKTKPIGLSRYENSAEHSWHVCLSALMLKDYANEKINIERVIKILLIHDLCEIDAGDTIVYESNSQKVKEAEELGIKRVIGILPKQQQKIYLSLWYEFEEGKTAESKYAKAIDNIPPLLHNLYDDGYGWREHNISKEQVFTVNRKIQEGSKIIWDLVESKLNEAVENGILK